MRRAAIFSLGIILVSGGLFSLTVFRSEVQIDDSRTIVSKSDGSIIKKDVKSRVGVDGSLRKKTIKDRFDYDDSTGNNKGKNLFESVVLIDRSIFLSQPTHHLNSQYCT